MMRCRHFTCHSCDDASLAGALAAAEARAREWQDAYINVCNDREAVLRERDAARAVAEEREAILAALERLPVRHPHIGPTYMCGWVDAIHVIADAIRTRTDAKEGA